MRTTVNINDDLLRRAKEIALRSGRPLGAIVDDALTVLMARDEGTRRSKVRLPTDGGSGLMPGVDLEDKDALAAILDARTPRAHR